MAALVVVGQMLAPLVELETRPLFLRHKEVMVALAQ
jgi:hypothetical protein